MPYGICLWLLSKWQLQQSYTCRSFLMGDWPFRCFLNELKQGQSGMHAFWDLPFGYDLIGSCNACRPFLVGDLPFGCYEASPQEAVKNAVRMMKAGNMDAVKLEGVLSRCCRTDQHTVWSLSGAFVCSSLCMCPCVCLCTCLCKKGLLGREGVASKAVALHDTFCPQSRYCQPFLLSYHFSHWLM